MKIFDSNKSLLDFINQLFLEKFGHKNYTWSLQCCNCGFMTGYGIENDLHYRVVHYGDKIYSINNETEIKKFLEIADEKNT